VRVFARAGGPALASVSHPANRVGAAGQLFWLHDSAANRLDIYEHWKRVAVGGWFFCDSELWGLKSARCGYN
jgi:hypothetical protein